MRDIPHNDLVKKVFILTAGFSDGHNAAARNVREALEQTLVESRGRGHRHVAADAVATDSPETRANRLIMDVFPPLAQAGAAGALPTARS